MRNRMMLLALAVGLPLRAQDIESRPERKLERMRIVEVGSIVDSEPIRTPTGRRVNVLVFRSSTGGRTCFESDRTMIGKTDLAMLLAGRLGEDYIALFTPGIITDVELTLLYVTRTPCPI